MNQFFQRLRIESKFFPRRIRNQHGAGLVVRLIKHVWPGIAAKILCIRGRQKRTLMVVKPPGNFRRV